MNNKTKVKGLLARKMEDPAYRKRHEESYELFKLEVQLLNALHRKHMTYEDLARALHTHKSNISRDLKAGGIRNASISRVIKMAKVLGMTFLPLMISEEKERVVLPKISEMALV
jgi:predicted XRE-type DNA-binding protein